MKVYTFSPFGYEGSLVEVEVDLRCGIPSVDIVGLADSQVKETRERVKAAFINSQIDFPAERVLIAFNPADLRKENPMELAMALAIINQQKPFSINEKVLILGELELSGKVREVRGTYSAIQTAKHAGFKKVIVPKNTGIDFSEFDVEYIEVQTLTEAVEKLRNKEFSKIFQKNEGMNNSEIIFPKTEEDDEKTMNDLLKRHPYASRAISIAIAGKLNILAYGTPGCGKTMLFQHFIQYLTPCLTAEELEPVKRLHSIAGIEYKTNNAPFRMPHQTASIEGMCGGGINCRPGEISLAHNGTLFLDEAAEFRTSVLQMLRVPLETKQITLARAGRSTIFPANFQLAMAVNPCPCGNYGEKDKVCLCSAKSIEIYWKKFSAPLLNRVQIKIHVEKDESETEHVSFEKIKEQIANAYRIQRKNRCYNKDIPICNLYEYVEKNAWIKHVSKDLEERTRDNILKIAITIANMDNRTIISKADWEEAYKLNSLSEIIPM